MSDHLIGGFIDELEKIAIGRAVLGALTAGTGAAGLGLALATKKHPKIKKVRKGIKREVTKMLFPYD